MTINEIAYWMLNQLVKDEVLNHSDVVDFLKKNAPGMVIENYNGYCINRKILATFRHLRKIGKIKANFYPGDCDGYWEIDGE